MMKQVVASNQQLQLLFYLESAHSVPQATSHAPGIFYLGKATHYRKQNVPYVSIPYSKQHASESGRNFHPKVEIP